MSEESSLLLERVAELRGLIETHAEETESERALADPVYDALIDAGFFRISVPRTMGGFELHPAEAYRVWEALAAIESAASWNVQMSCGMGAILGAWLPAEGSKEIFAGGPDTIFAGSFFPPGPAVRESGGFRVTARGTFASGCHRAHWLALPIVEVTDDATAFDPNSEDPPAIGVAIPRDEVDVVDTWQTVGMRGTFSSDVLVDDVFVPDHRVARLQEEPVGAPPFDGPLYRTMLWPVVQGEACTSVGIAQAAVDELLELCNRKTPAFHRLPLRSREMVHHHIGKARSLVEASRSSLRSSISDAFKEAEESGRMSEESKLSCQLAASFAAETSAEAVDLVCEVAGSSAIRIGRRFERFHRDVHVLTKHASKAYSRYEDVGRMMLGIPPIMWTLAMGEWSGHPEPQE